MPAALLARFNRALRSGSERDFAAGFLSQALVSRRSTRNGEPIVSGPLLATKLTSLKDDLLS